MSLDTMLARLEARTITPVTAITLPSVTLNTLQNIACTIVTPVTDNCASMLHMDVLEFFNERAGISEYDSWLSCADAESQAMAELQGRQ